MNNLLTYSATVHVLRCVATFCHFVYHCVQCHHRTLPYRCTAHIVGISTYCCCHRVTIGHIHNSSTQSAPSHSLSFVIISFRLIIQSILASSDCTLRIAQVIDVKSVQSMNAPKTLINGFLGRKSFRKRRHCCARNNRKILHMCINAK